MLSQVVVWRFQLLNDIGGAAASALEGHISMCLIHVINVVLVMHCLSGVLILEYFC